MPKQWRTLFKVLGRYRKAYGGVRGMIGSPFFGIAVLIAGLSYSQWLEPRWVERTESLIPSLLGFSLGTYAILFSIMSSRFKGALRAVRAPSGHSYLESINATFFHFVFVQVVALVWAFVYQDTWLFDVQNMLKWYIPYLEFAYSVVAGAGSFVGLFLLIYSVLLTVASALAIYRIALIKDPAEDDRPTEGGSAR